MFFKRRQYQCRVLVKGRTASGKTNVILRMLYGLYNDNHIPTVEDHYMRKYHPSRGNVTLEVVDTSEMYCRRAEQRPTTMADGNIRMFVYSVNDYASFDHVLRNIKVAIDDISAWMTPVIVVGAKCDLEDERQVFPEDVKNHLRVLGVQHLEVSAKKNKHMNDLVSMVVDTAIKRRQLAKKMTNSIKKLQSSK
ncbi:GTP-binding protein drn-1-like [Ptychodera flava]|uniref:GTP-binding protein drn-1-like n=1 Tax=Ptychodera flava TaxID=63121 RepID=UPI003969E3A3